ncbi:MAG: hypothetical protein IT371_28835 [Deltaproteobacteria bacterium]|nr:hypothetical protein [Deltaproteobacteria bacterium]
MKTQRWLCGALLAGLVAGCGSSQTGRKDARAKADGFTLGDGGWGYLDGGGPIPDIWTPTGDLRPAGDGPASGDASGKCSKPQGASCTGCAADESCTAANGGTCAKKIALSGSSTDAKNLLMVAVAYVDCWNKQSTGSKLCFTFDSCAMQGSLNGQMVKEWVCKAQVSDFPDSATHGTARSILACNGIWEIERPQWKLSGMNAGEDGLNCMSYHDYGTMPWDLDRVDIHDCAKFPP